MKIRRHIGDYNFIADQESGMTFRWGKTFEDDPTFAPVPELVDISISNHCSKGCDYCYRDSKPNHSFMSLDDYKFVLSSLNHKKYGNVFQVALGGGEPLEHPEIFEILDITRQFNLVPNFTTNGENITQTIVDRIKGKVGAVAISLNNMHDIDNSKIQLLIKGGIRTNIHYVIDRSNIKQAIQILEGDYNNKLKGVNAIIFLTFKPSGRGNSELVLVNDSSLVKFLELVDNNGASCNIGFDACFVPMLMRFTKTNIDFIDSCEVGYFSVYIDENLRVSPCSFSNNRDSYSLKEFDFYTIWNNKFDNFRTRITNTCNQECNAKINCKGSCPYFPEITTCYKN
ncbi:radical SAM protein with 4Fe4S-binding SPASM domain [Ancylomarina subtilis]|uniref:Radical SAM protein with 4Fe4S-binding SPASM domain n=1 Tax=Ancylomarina subtilis TaxID=1639035 RepID=A0A4Q7VIE7_9BACT|nr:radical SAM protein [Ancylomarina subtilis]RZT95920.1 radical SAM protein with 4Fe4S-binding SPASM domain [Ancylomarina subtilis]